jgi:mannosyltransferase OCH1-like enzyme
VSPVVGSRLSPFIRTTEQGRIHRARTYDSREMSSPIPASLHRVLLPPLEDTGSVRRNWRRFARIHPDWELRTWRAADKLSFPETFDALQRCHSPAQQADLMRLEILWREGGIYVDTDCEPVRSMEPLRELSCFFGSEDGSHYSTSVIGAGPGHPAIRSYLDGILRGGRVGLALPVNEATGPVFATEVLTGRTDVTLLPPEAFYPEPFEDSKRRFRRSRRRLAGPGTYVVHRWAHSWKQPPPGETAPPAQTNG